MPSYWVYTSSKTCPGTSSLGRKLQAKTSRLKESFSFHHTAERHSFQDFTSLLRLICTTVSSLFMTVYTVRIPHDCLYSVRLIVAFKVAYYLVQLYIFMSRNIFRFLIVDIWTF